MAEPRFSILTPVYRPPRRALQAMLASVGRQSFDDWEHCLVDDRSERRHVRKALDAGATSDPRFRVHYRGRRGGIVAATNDAIKMARGEYLAFLDNDDELHPRALELVAAAIDQHPDADYLYSDQDKINKRGLHSEPFVKPDWSPQRLPAQMYTTHFRVIRRSLVEELGGLREGFDGSQDWDLALRIAERSDRVVHVPGLLYHWRSLPTSAAGSAMAKPWAHDSSHRAVSEHVERLGIQASVETIPGFPGHYWLRPSLRESPLVSIVIPTGGRSRPEDGDSGPLVVNCVRSILERSSYENLELVIVIDDQAPEGVADQLRELGGERVRLVGFGAPFNFSAKVNLGVRESSGEQILLLNDDVEALPQGWRPVRNGGVGGLPDWDIREADGRRAWIESLLVYSLQRGVGAAGAKLYLPDGRLQHGGVIGLGGLVGHPYYLWPGDEPGYMGNLMLACNFLAVTGACLMTPRAAFDSVGGFDEGLPLNYNDVDYCLKLGQAGLRSVMVPQAELLHRESASRGNDPPSEAEIATLQQRWSEKLEHDPYYGAAFIDSNFVLPVLNRRGDFQDRPDVWTYLIRTQTLFREGGVRLVLARAYGKLRRVALRRIRWTS